jgi:hypothetical protein
MRRPQGGFLHFPFFINATSTPQQKNRTGTHKQALAGTGK